MLMFGLWLLHIFLHKDHELFNLLCFRPYALNIEIANSLPLNAKPHHKLTCLIKSTTTKEENEFFSHKLPGFHDSTLEPINVVLYLTTTQLVLGDQFLW
jgi:hypothetical protein